MIPMQFFVDGSRKWMRQGRSMAEERVTVPDVLIVRRTDFGWLCEIARQAVFLGTLQIAPGTLVPVDGERGPVTLTLSAARDLGLGQAA
jgi:hypothetical protein